MSMPNINNRRRGRPNTGRRGRSVDKNLLSDGVYANQRFTHAATSLIGCEVQVQVKNGGIYEGIFRTFSGKMDVVLDKAHKLDDTPGRDNLVPAKDRIIEEVIFSLNDIVMISALNVEPDYAYKDTFTDTAISSKHNGQVGEAKELQPWDAGGPDSATEALDTDSSAAANGWDASEMFNTNRDKFNVKSTYDPNLPQYTTPLVKQDTKEYKAREAEAAKLAQEIEGSEDHKRLAELENGDGDDEEMKYSAVVRDASGVHGGKDGLDGKTSNKTYIPPHARKNPQHGRAVRSSGHTSIQHQTQVSTNKPQQPSPGSNPASAMSAVVSGPPPVESSDVRVNGNKEVKKLDNPDKYSPPVSASETTKTDSAATSYNKGRDEEIQELRDFKTKFNYSTNDGERKDKRTQGAPASVQQACPQPTGAPPPRPADPQPQPLHQSPIQSPHAPAHNPVATHPQQQQQQQQLPTPPAQQPHQLSPQQQVPLEKVESKASDAEKKEHSEAETKIAETVKKSTLNPNAKEFIFNPNAKPFTPKQYPNPVATPPRPATQSPVMAPQMPPGQPLYPGPGPGPYMVPVSVAQGAPTRKKAVVSLKPDYTTVAAATGQPLLAPHGMATPQAQYAYIPVQQQGGNMQQVAYHPMMSLAAPGQRMVNPTVVQASPGDQSSVNQLTHAQAPVFMPHQAQPGTTGVPGHMGPIHAGSQPPPHMGPHHQAMPSHTQPSHMNAQSTSGHPAPSPVHQHPGPQQHPPQSGTPQPPHILYQTNMTQQPGPHLQPSPHTPTSPQNMYPQTMTFSAAPYSFASQAPLQTMPQMTQQQHTSVVHAHQHQPQHSHGPQIVMMHQQPQGQMQPNAQMQHAHHMQGLNLQGPTQVHGQAGPAMLPQHHSINMSTANIHSQMHPVPHIPSQGHPPPMPTYHTQ